MSHEATSWAVKQRGLKPTAKVILWHLADRHNPDFGCFPSQARLADDAEVSRATLNRHLDELEERGLIARIRSIDPRTKRKNCTRYVLAFEDAFSGGPSGDGEALEDDPEPEIDHGSAALGGSAVSDASPEIGHGAVSQTEKPCLKMRHGAVSQKSPEPCLIRRESRVSNCDINLVKEPLREPVSAAPASPSVDNLPPGSQPVDLDALAALWADKLNAGAFVPSSAITSRLARHMVDQGLVKWDQLRNAGILV